MSGQPYDSSAFYNSPGMPYNPDTDGYSSIKAVGTGIGPFDIPPPCCCPGTGTFNPCPDANSFMYLQLSPPPSCRDIGYFNPFELYPYTCRNIEQCGSPTCACLSPTATGYEGSIAGAGITVTGPDGSGCYSVERDGVAAGTLCPGSFGGLFGTLNFCYEDDCFNSLRWTGLSASAQIYDCLNYDASCSDLACCWDPTGPHCFPDPGGVFNCPPRTVFVRVVIDGCLDETVTCGYDPADPNSGVFPGNCSPSWTGMKQIALIGSCPVGLRVGVTSQGLIFLQLIYFGNSLYPPDYSNPYLFVGCPFAFANLCCNIDDTDPCAPFCPGGVACPTFSSCNPVAWTAPALFQVIAGEGFGCAVVDIDCSGVYGPGGFIDSCFGTDSFGHNCVKTGSITVSE